MATFEQSSRFKRDYKALTPEQQGQFRNAVEKFVTDLNSGDGFGRGLRVKKVQASADVFEMTWANDGRATFHYGNEQLDGQPHVVWRRVGTHDIFNQP